MRTSSGVQIPMWLQGTDGQHQPHWTYVHSYLQEGEQLIQGPPSRGPQFASRNRFGLGIVLKSDGAVLNSAPKDFALLAKISACAEKFSHQEPDDIDSGAKACRAFLTRQSMKHHGPKSTRTLNRICPFQSVPFNIKNVVMRPSWQVTTRSDFLALSGGPSCADKKVGVINVQDRVKPPYRRPLHTRDVSSWILQVNLIF